MDRIKYGKFEADFNKNLINADEKAQSIPQKTKKEIEAELLTTLLDIAKKSPAASILEAWRNIEIALSQFIEEVSPV